MFGVRREPQTFFYDFGLQFFKFFDVRWFKNNTLRSVLEQRPDQKLIKLDRGCGSQAILIGAQQANTIAARRDF